MTNMQEQASSFYHDTKCHIQHVPNFKILPAVILRLEAKVGQKSITWIRLIMIDCVMVAILAIRSDCLYQFKNLMLFEEFQDCNHGGHLGYWN